MDRLRVPFLVIAIVLSLIIVLIETGTAIPGILSSPPVANLPLPSVQLSPDQHTALSQLQQQSRPPGFAVPYLALIDVIVLFTLVLIGAPLLITDRLQGRIQGIASLIFSLILLVITITLIFVALGSLILMISLLLSFPFGTIVYLIIYGSFNRPGADIALSLIMLLKLAVAVALFLAQQRFLQNVGLILLIVTSLVGNLLVTFLLGLVPGILVSITDAIAAIIVGIIAVIWAIVLLVGSVIGILRLIHLNRPAVVSNAVNAVK